MRLVLFFTLLFLAGIHAPAYAGDGNQVQVINHGLAAFEKRLEMIEHAEKSIDVEYFIYNIDEAGKLFTQALVKKKQERPEIRIRILVDASSTVLQLKSSYINELISRKIEVRYFNAISLVHFDSAQYRDHRKLLSIDGKEAITGSRNIADEYFDLSKEFNFRDRDLWVSGPIVKEMEHSFNAYWNNEKTAPAPLQGTLNNSKKLRFAAKAKQFFVETRYDRWLLNKIKLIGAEILADPRSTGSCDSLTYVTDPAGYPNHQNRKVLSTLFHRMNAMDDGDTLYMESPYFIVHDQYAKDEMAFLQKKNIKEVLLTNSLASTDAYYVAANFYPQASLYQNLSNSKMYIFDGSTPKNTDFLRYSNNKALTANATWGIHSKTFVFSDRSFATGTFNVDPRSANLNSEMLMFCEGNRNLTQFVLDDIQGRISQSDLLGKDGKLQGGKSIFDNVDALKRLKFKIAILPSEWFSYLL